MHKLALLGMMLAALGGLGCSSTAAASTTGMTDCTPGTPDAGAASYVCDISWSCAGDTELLEMRCTIVDGNYQCDCLSSGATARTFTVNPFTCDSAGATPAATSGCGWSFM